MRSFTNSDGNVVKLTKDCLDTAVQIKLELQNSSPSRKCNWNTLCDLMKKEGFEDVEPNESFRCLVKAYQKQVGLLPSVDIRQNMVATSKLDSVRRLVGEIRQEKEENKLVLKELNKNIRDVSYISMISDEIRDLMLDEIDIHISPYSYSPRFETNGDKMLVTLSDWHLGLKTESWNLKVAKEQIDIFTNKIISYANKFNIREVMVAGCGDLIENIYMRPTNQAFNCELSFSEQIVEVTKTIMTMISNLSEYLNVVYLGSISGNHGRISDKIANVDGDNACKIYDNSIKTFIDMVNSPRITYKTEGYDSKEIITEINGKLVKITHGDDEQKTGSDRIKKHISMDNAFYDLLVIGHFHSHHVYEENDGRTVVGLGCLPKGGSYSRRLKFNTTPSQCIILFSGEEIIPIKISL